MGARSSIPVVSAVPKSGIANGSSPPSRSANGLYAGPVAYTGTVTFTGSGRATYGRPTSRGKRLRPESPCTLEFQLVIRSEFVNSREIVEHAGVGVEECKLLFGGQVADDECALSYSPEPFSTLQIGKLGTFGYGQAEL